MQRRKRGVTRWCRPPGLCVAILGPDGSGKSSVIESFARAAEGSFAGTVIFHLRPRILGGTASSGLPSTDPHGQMPRGSVLSIAKVLFLWADYTFGYWLRVYPLQAQGKLVIFDRYYHDLLIDPLRFRYGGPMWLARLVGRAIPAPDLLLILDAPASVLQTRKQEVSPQESARQAEAFRAIAQSPATRERARLLDASQPLESVVCRCVEATLELKVAHEARMMAVQ